MTAAVYAREIRAQYDCGECAASPSTLRERGHCVGPVPGGLLTLRCEGKHHALGATYAAEFDRCPVGLLRHDLNPRGVDVAVAVSRAAAAEADKRWPALPARLSALLSRWRHAEGERMESEHDAVMRGMEERGSR